MPNKLLDRDELLLAVADLAGLDHAARGTYSGSHASAPARERWRFWSTGGAAPSCQSCHRLERWPRPESALDPLVCGLPATAATVTVALMRAPAETGGADDLVTDLAIRLSAPDAGHLSAAEDALDTLVREAGGRSRPLRGQQHFGLAATLPLGGFVR
jgi:hypothetical protein